MPIRREGRAQQVTDSTLSTIFNDDDDYDQHVSELASDKLGQNQKIERIPGKNWPWKRRREGVKDGSWARMKPTVKRSPKAQ